jgi:Holliday junction resolvasome RuvABC endonuclease subunit
MNKDEIKGIKKYLENVKKNVVGKGRVNKIKVKVMYEEKRVKF